MAPRLVGGAGRQSRLLVDHGSEPSSQAAGGASHVQARPSMRAVGALLAVALTGCAAPPLSPLQRSALLQRIADEGNSAMNAVRARDRAVSALALSMGDKDPGPSAGTLAFLASENAALRSDVAAALR
jgi:hypothetical protein